ncbi:MAG: hypothetical protein A2X25_02435 [Chloroflexi bacterium GWB2_49_20]|nr:MAG: hypothetical protein A2X25_02435 [Chloroflexi bacterium GWB2_49_20]OGN79711.1 MAG: hypothetical protein A2X26_07415 [Chloroflexi bacterium GWC2_49_37]OGN85959.1 MAG: hypothetical protein A2X27_00175 [Chloroflexi bacterium GWD2_49_16]HBG73980.1 hypothetical protein [Anaerolineae bacterium]HCC78754.1 hypothetical protein [Anaerolineae bacterium]
MFTKANIGQFLEGLAILGTGGGGSPEWGRIILENDLDKGRAATIVKPENVPDDAIVASGGIMGSVKTLEKISPSELVAGWEKRFELTEAFELQAKTIGKKIDYIVAFEMGGLNTPVMLSLGARTGIPVIDGDGLGRAAPETHMISFIGHGVSLTPMPLVDSAGNAVVVHYGVDNTYADQLGRWVVTHGGGMGANCHYPMSGKKLKEAVIPYTITGASALGEVVYKARTEKNDPVGAIARFVGGQHIHTGTIQKIQEKEWEGFYFINLELSGGAELVIKNEYMSLFLNGKPVTIFPDFILGLDPQTGRGLMSADLKIGDEMALVVYPCHPRLRNALKSKEGQNAFSPKRFGQPDLIYKPVEELLNGIK